MTHTTNAQRNFGNTLIACVKTKFLLTKASVRAILNEMAGASILASQRIFFGRNCKEWTIDPD